MTRDSHFYATRHFSSIPKQQITEIARKGGETRRSPELQKAWNEEARIKNMRAIKIPVKQIASEYKIPVRACYRILGK